MGKIEVEYGKFCYLIMVNGDGNNNKYYQMKENNGQIEVEYGRVDSTKSYKKYPLNKWNSIFNSKLKKGYKDITELMTVESEHSNSEMFISEDKDVVNFFEQIEKWAKDTIDKNYKVSINSVTQKMIDEAQMLIDKLYSSFVEGREYIELNDILIKIYTVIPRKMNNVRDFIFKDNDKEYIKQTIDNEQKLLDTMSGQVIANKVNDNNCNDEKINILDKLGLEIKLVKDENTINNIKNLMGDSKNLIGKVFEVKNLNTESIYNKIYNSESERQELLLWHGSRNQNWFNILQTGLLIRPSGAVYTGSMFGDACYFANKAKKSIGYSSLSGSYWAKGNQSKSFIALFKVNVGKQKHIYKHSSECYRFNENNIKPYNSVYAHGGADLRNDEFMIYNPNRCTIKYMVEINKN